MTVNTFISYLYFKTLLKVIWGLVNMGHLESPIANLEYDRNFFCDTLDNFGDTQMCRDTQFEKHWFRN
jgi:hypothetical protein